MVCADSGIFFLGPPKVVEQSNIDEASFRWVLHNI